MGIYLEAILMGKGPKVIVCVPAYNAEKYLEETLHSLISQDYKNYAVVVIDNASTDGTGRIAKKLEGKALRYVRFEKYLPVCENWNRCFDFAKGDYLAIAHSDDVYEKEFIPNEVAFLEKNQDCFAAFCSATVISSSGKEIGEMKSPAFSGGKASARELIEFSVKNGFFPLIAPTLMVRSSAARICGGFDEHLMSACDMDLFIRLAETGKIGVLEEKLIRYRVHPAQVSTSGKALAESQRENSEFFDILEKAAKRSGVELSDADKNRLSAYRRWGRVVDALKQSAAGNSGIALSMTRENLRLSDAFISFPFPRFFFRTAFSSAFLVSQYVGLGKAFSSAVYWYRRRKRA